MKKATLILAILALVLAACQAAAPGIPTMTPTPTLEPKCKGAVCVKQVFVSATADNIFIEFDLVDSSGKVQVGEAPQFTAPITIGLFKVDGNVYLIGGTWGPSAEGSFRYTCYAGNDMPWSNGKMASSCGVSFGLNQTQEKIKIGDKLRVEIIQYDFKQVLSLTKRE